MSFAPDLIGQTALPGTVRRMLKSNRYPKLVAFQLALVLLAAGRDGVQAGPLLEGPSLYYRTGGVDTDFRMSEQVFAKNGEANAVPIEAVQKRFGATGVLECPGGHGSAQLTGASDVITTAAHIFFDRKTCARRDFPERCAFVTKIGKLTKRYRVSLSAMGFECPGGKQSSWDDWAVLQLDKPIVDVGYYRIAPDLIEDFAVAGGEVISVAGRSADFLLRDTYGKAITPYVFPKSIEKCQVRYRHRRDGQVAALESTCDAASGASGGSLLLSSDKRDYLIAITTGGQETEAELAEAVRNRRENRRPFEQGQWFTLHVALHGAFLKALQKAINRGERI